MDELDEYKEAQKAEWKNKNMRICPMCKKEFCIAGFNMTEYLYKRKNALGKTAVYCSYSCWNKSK